MKSGSITLGDLDGWTPSRNSSDLKPIECAECGARYATRSPSTTRCPECGALPDQRTLDLIGDDHDDGLTENERFWRTLTSQVKFWEKETDSLSRKLDHAMGQLDHAIEIRNRFFPDGNPGINDNAEETED